MFITDRDLLPLEPNLFRDVSWLGQQIYRGQVSVSGGELAVVTGDLKSAGLEPGHVVVAGDLPLEVVSIDSATTAQVSLPRARRDSAVRVPADFAARAAVVTSFSPQISLVHGQLLAMLELEPWRAQLKPGAPGEQNILNPQELELIEALGTLHQVYSAAAAVPGAGSPAYQRAEMYRERFANQRWRVRVQIDLDGDGLADAVRTLNVMHLRRA